MTIFNIELRHQKTDRDAVRQFAPGGESGRLLKPECQARWEREVGVFKEKRLIGPLVELQQLADRLRDAGHRMQVVGAAASSMVFHAMGLSPICPVEHELCFERFIDPNHETTTPKLDLGGMVSMGGLELLQFLRKHEYAIRVFEHEANVNGENIRFETIGVKRTCEPGEGPRIILQVAAPSILAIANLVSRDRNVDCLHDPTTWELLGSGDTDGISNLEDAATQDRLRSRKPGTLEELATVMITQGPGRNEERDEPPVYQEDLMTLLHQETGMLLRDAYELVRTLAKGKQNQVAAAEERALNLVREKGIDETTMLDTWVRVKGNSRLALCKAHVFATAFHCLQAAYVKARHPDEFRAVATTLHN